MIKRIGLSIMLIALLVGIVVLFLRSKRPPRIPLEEQLFQGVTYIRQVKELPRPLMIHIVKIELEQAGIEFLVTPGELDQKREYRAQKTSDFVREYQLQVGINGGFFKPFYSSTPFSYYPHSGELVDISGLSIGNGIEYSEYQYAMPNLCFVSDKALINRYRCRKKTNQALAGNELLVEDGQIQVEEISPDESNLHPRTVTGVDEEGLILWLIVVDGRQSGYSEGMTHYELAQLMVELGADDAINLDGGGSSTLVVRRGEDIELLNAPYHTRIWMRERPVANHLGVYAASLEK